MVETGIEFTMSAETKLGEEAKIGGEKPGDDRPVITPAEARRRQRALTRQLRVTFEEAVREPIPEDMLKLLRKIDEQK